MSEGSSWVVQSDDSATVLETAPPRAALNPPRRDPLDGFARDVPVAVPRGGRGKFDVVALGVVGKAASVGMLMEA